MLAPETIARKAAGALACAVAAIAVAAILGWAFSIEALTRVQPAWPAMKLNTAALLALLTLVLGLELRGAAPRVRVTLAAVAFSICALTLLEYATAVDFGIDNAFGTDVATPNNPLPGRMSPLAGTAGLSLAAALLVPKRFGRWHDALAIAGFAIALFCVTGYAYDAEVLLRYTQVGFHSAWALLLLAFAILSSRPESGWSKYVWSHGPSGVVARRILPVAVAAPVLFGYVRLQVTRAGLVPEEQATALSSSLMSLMIVAVALFAVQRIHSLEVERTKALGRLRQAMQRVEEAEKATRRGAWDWDTANDRATWSAGMYKLFGVDERDFVNSNENFLALVLPEDRERLMAAMAKAVAKPGRFLQDYRLRRPDGKVLHIRGEGDVVVDAHGNATRLHGFVQDVSEQLEVERLRVLHEIDSYRARFVNIAAHEMRTPLLPMRAQVHLLRTSRGEGLTPPQRRSLELIGRNLERLSALVEDLLEAARHGSGKLELVMQDLDVSAVVADVVQDYAQAAATRKVTLESRKDGKATVVGDPRRVRQVVANLLGNAMKFTPPGGSIEVRIKGGAQAVQVDVTDSGIGLEPAAIGKLFQPFSQVHDVMQVSEPGSGLGLYLSKALVELHGGAISASSPGAGQGSTFTIVLPVDGPSGEHRSRGAFAGPPTSA